MKIDGKNLACPAPVVQTKRALEGLSEGEELEILLNTEISKNNVLKFLNSLNLNPVLEENAGEIRIRVRKKSGASSTLADESVGSVLFLKSDKIGTGELGKNLLVGFLDTLRELESRPAKILCVNESVLINCEETHPAHEAMRGLENIGVELVSCGACLEFFGKTKALKIGSVGNAYAILSELFSKAKIITL